VAICYKASLLRPLVMYVSGAQEGDHCPALPLSVRPSRGDRARRMLRTRRMLRMLRVRRVLRMLRMSRTIVRFGHLALAIQGSLRFRIETRSSRLTTSQGTCRSFAVGRRLST
jgi:hypothetical protein